MKMTAMKMEMKIMLDSNLIVVYWALGVWSILAVVIAVASYIQAKHLTKNDNGKAFYMAFMLIALTASMTSNFIFIFIIMSIN